MPPNKRETNKLNAQDSQSHEPMPPELFVIRDEQGPILYAPLGNLLARCNESAASLALAYAKGERTQESLDEDEQSIIEALDAHGFFAWRPYPYDVEAFKPTQVTLFPTNKCNLRCSYCYAYGGEGGKNGEPLSTMDLDVAKSAIDLIAQNAKDLQEGGCRNFLVSIHGNGEPFCAFDLIKDIVFYARDISERLDIPVVFNAATNGVLTDEQLDFVVANFDSVNISFDGLPEFQNAQRPTATGGGSFERAHHTMQRLGEAGVNFGIRTTVTTQMVNRLGEITAFVADNYPTLEQLHLEPVWECGRCLVSTDTMPDPHVFVEKYLEAQQIAQEKGIRLVFSGCRQDIVTDCFCKVANGSFTVTPTGNVTSCYEVSYKSDPRSDRFFYGSYDFDEKRFVFNPQKQAELHRINVRNMPFCNDCFCRWHCAGDCAAKVLEGIEPEQHAGSVRCIITRALTLKQIQRKLDWRPQDVEQQRL